MITDFVYLVAAWNNLIKEKCQLALRFLQNNNDEFLALLENHAEEYMPTSLQHYHGKYLLEISSKIGKGRIHLELAKNIVLKFSKYQECAEKVPFCESRKEADTLLPDKPIGTYVLVQHLRNSKSSYYLSFVNEEKVIKHIQYYISSNRIVCNVRGANDRYLKYRHMYDFIANQIKVTPRFLNTSLNFIELHSRFQPPVIMENKYEEQLQGSVYLLEQEYGDSHSNSEFPIIGTRGFSTCIAILIYSKYKSCVIHAAATNDLIKESLQVIIKQVFGEAIFNNPSSLFVTLAGCLQNSSKFAENVKWFFQEKDIPFNTRLLYGKIRKIAVDSRNGRIICNGVSENTVPTYQGDNFKLELENTKNEFIKKNKLTYKQSNSIFFKTICDGKINFQTNTLTYPDLQLDSSQKLKV